MRRLAMSRPRSLVAAAVAVAVIGTGSVAAVSTAGSRLFTQDTSGVKDSAEAGDFLGVEIAMGDFDGDRRADVAVGAPYEDAKSRRDSGQVHVLYGTGSGPSTSNDQNLSFGTNGVAGNNRAGDLFGSALAVGDFNGDARDDLAVGVPGRDAGGIADSGMVVVLYGTDNGLRGAGSQTLTKDSLVDPASTAGASDAFGHALAVGDFDGDGIDDLAVGAPGDGTHVPRGGAVTVFSGSATGLATDVGSFLTQNDPGVDVAETDDAFGWSLASGDFDGDGVDELVVGAPGETTTGFAGAGMAHVFASTETGLTAAIALSEAATFIKGEPEAGDRFATSLATGDFDGDAHDDLVVGVPGEGKGRRVATGAVHVLLGSAEGLGTATASKITQNSSGVPGSVGSGDDFGFALAVGDFNDNGKDDLAVGAPGEHLDGLPGVGAVHVFFGNSSGVRTQRSERWQPGEDGVPGTPDANAGFGRAIAAGDIDRDGRADLVIGAPGDSTTQATAGGSFVVLYG